MKQIFFATFFMIFLVGCGPLTLDHYKPEPDNTAELKKLKSADIGLGEFINVQKYKGNCSITPPANQTYAAYTKQAFSKELKAAGLLNENNPRITLSGRIEKLESSTGTWDMTLTLISSNGKSMTTSEHYEFDTAGGCIKTSDSFISTLQEVFYSAVTSEEFLTLID